MIIKIKWLLPLIALAIMISPIVALASDVTHAQYSGLIAVTNNATGTQTNIIATFTNPSPANMISWGMANSTMTDVVVQNAGIDYAFEPAQGATPWKVFVPSIAGKATSYLGLYSGNASGGKIAYFPDTAGMTISDDASMEPGDNFSIQTTAYLNASGNIINKSGAFVMTYDNATSNVTATAFGGTAVYFPNGPSQTEIPNQSPGTGANWDKVDDPVASPDDAATFIYTDDGSSTTYTDLYTINSSSPIPVNATITSVVISIRGITDSANGKYKYAVSLGGTAASGDLTSSASWTTNNITIARPGGGSWARADFSTLLIGAAEVSYAVGVNAKVTQVYVTVNYSMPMVVTGITPGEYAITARSNATNMWVSVGNTSSSNITAFPITDNSNNWTIGSAATPYITSYKHYVNGILKSDIGWKYNTTGPYVFSDASGNSNFATPSFLSTGTTNVTANVTSFGPVTTAVVPTSTTNSTWSMIKTVPNQPSRMYTELQMNFPGGAWISSYCTTHNIPLGLIMFPIAYGSTALLGIGAILLSRSAREPRGSLLAQALTCLVVLGYWWVVGGGVIPGWTLIPFGIEALACISHRGDEPYKV